VVAQAACEVHTEEVLTRLTRAAGVSESLGEWLLTKALRGYNPTNGRVRGLYDALAGQELASWEGWSDYHRLRSLRDDFAHKGAQVTQEDAGRFIVLVSALMERTTADAARVEGGTH